MPESQPPIALKGVSLAELRKLIDQRRLPPVEKWNPAHCGHSGMRIARDGTWFHDGTPIERPAMVRLFATILRREPDGRHVLVTPVEKLTIDVDCTALGGGELVREGGAPARRPALAPARGAGVVVGRDHPLTIVEGSDGPSPRVAVRHGLEAELSRPIYYELAELALNEGGDPPGVWSDGCFFPLAKRA